MKKLITTSIIAISLIQMTGVSAEIGGTITRMAPAPTYSSLELLLEAQGDVCELATDGINSIMIDNGEAGASTLAYTPNPEYSCTAYKLSDNDMSFYNTVKDRIDSNYVGRVDTAIEKYGERMKMLRWSDERRGEAHAELIEKVETMISDLLMKYPQDIALPEKINDKYLKLTLIKFELMLLDM